MALIPYRDIIVNGSNFTSYTGWTTTGAASIGAGQAILPMGAMMTQKLDVNIIPTKITVELVGQFNQVVLPGDTKGFMRLRTLNDTRWIPLPPIGTNGQFTLNTVCEFTFDTQVVQDWYLDIFSTTDTLRVSSIKVTLFADSDFVELGQQLDEKFTSLSIDIDGLAYTVGQNKLAADGAITTLRSDIAITVSQINARVSQEVQTINGETARLQGELNIQAGQIALRATSATVDALGGRVNNAEININAAFGQISQKVSTTDYNGNTVASLINQTATTVTIEAQKINFNGAVVANGTITGTSSINITTDAYVGNNVYLGQFNNGQKGIIFNQTASIRSWGAGYTSLMVSAENFNVNQGNVSLGGGGYYVSLAGSVDLSGAVSNIGYVSSLTPGLEITRNTVDPSKLAVRLYGAFLGNLDMQPF